MKGAFLPAGGPPGAMNCSFFLPQWVRRPEWAPCEPLPAEGKAEAGGEGGGGRAGAVRKRRLMASTQTLVKHRPVRCEGNTDGLQDRTEEEDGRAGDGTDTEVISACPSLWGRGESAFS